MQLYLKSRHSIAMKIYFTISLSRYITDKTFSAVFLRRGISRQMAKFSQVLFVDLLIKFISEVSKLGPPDHGPAPRGS